MNKQLPPVLGDRALPLGTRPATLLGLLPPCMACLSSMPDLPPLPVAQPRCLFRPGQGPLSAEQHPRSATDTPQPRLFCLRPRQVTLLSPRVLGRHGMQPRQLQQEAGEFVVTFPSAYHASLDLGADFCFSAYVLICQPAGAGDYSQKYQ